MTLMMLDADVVAVSPATVYRVLRAAGVLAPWNTTSSKGTGFVQPLRPYEHWHVDISYVNVAGTSYYLSSILDGATRFLVHRELREHMTTADVEVVIQRAREEYPDERPRIISDNGPQFMARDFKDFIRVAGTTHVRRSPHCPQLNGKLERYHQTLNVTTIRPKAPDWPNQAWRVVTAFVAYYNHHRLHSAIGFITPADMLAGRAEQIWATRDRKLENGASPEPGFVAGAVEANDFAESRRTDDRGSTPYQTSPRIIHASGLSNHHSSQVPAEPGHSVLTNQRNTARNECVWGASFGSLQLRHLFARRLAGASKQQDSWATSPLSAVTEDRMRKENRGDVARSI